jgi:hypothetical protein
VGLGPFDSRNTKDGVAGGAGIPAFPQKPRKGKAPKPKRVPKTPSVEQGIGDGVETRIPDEVMIELADKLTTLIIEAVGIPLAPYQTEFATRMVRSILLEDVAELTALISRQAGKTETIAIVVAGLMVLLPTLAQQIPDERLAKFKNGIHIGVFAPSYDTVNILCARIQDRVYSHGMREVMQDEEVGIDLPEDAKALALPNGSRVEAHTTHPKVPIEGHTYHLIITDETQFIPDIRMKKSIRPSGARTAATIVMLGTPSTERCEFYDACQRNRRKDLNLSGKDKWKKQHFEYDWTECARWSKRYAKYVKAERDRLGEDSDEFRMAYRLHWILERSTFISTEELNECGLKRNRLLRRQIGSGRASLFMCASNLVTFDSKNRHVAGIDIGRDGDSTVVTVLRVWWENPIKVGEKTVYYTHIANWLELHGDDHEQQYPQIVSFLKNYRIDCVAVDATGRGDPIYDRLRAELKPFDIQVVAFVFNQATKHQGYTLLQQEVRANRATYPAGYPVQKLTKYKRFKQQFEDLEKGWRGKYMVVEAPKRSSGGRKVKDMHDDYPDSYMLAIYATQSGAVLKEVEVAPKNPFYTKTARHQRMREGRAWWRG